MSRIRRKWSVAIVLVGLMTLSCWWLDAWPQISWVWIAICCLLVMSWWVRQQRYRRPYSGYAMMISLVLRAAIVRGGSQIGLLSSALLLYGLILNIFLSLWMLWPMRRGAIPLLCIIGWGGLMAVPRSPKPLTPKTIADTLPRVQLYRERVADDELVTLTHKGVTTQPRSGQRVSVDDDQVTIQYASTVDHANTIVVHTHTLNTIQMSPQSALVLAYQDGQWSGSMQGDVKWYGSDTISFAKGDLLQDQTPHSAHQKLIHQAHQIALELSPSGWTQTTIGASLLRLKLQSLARLDGSYDDDVMHLYQYQCLVYSQRCEKVSPEWQHYSIGAQTRDGDLQTTTTSGAVELGGIRKKIRRFF